MFIDQEGREAIQKQMESCSIVIASDSWSRLLWEPGKVSQFRLLGRDVVYKYHELGTFKTIEEAIDGFNNPAKIRTFSERR
jgi:hypothetical protein